MSNLIERRAFLKALVASVVAAGLPLPIGFPKPERGLSYVVFENLDLSSFDNQIPQFEYYMTMPWHNGPFKLEKLFVDGKEVNINEEIKTSSVVCSQA